MKTRYLLLAGLTFALAAPTTLALAAPGQDAPSRSATIAKKKPSYCAKQAKRLKAKSVAKVKSQKFFLYTNKKQTEYVYCSESPKRTGAISVADGIAKTSNLKAVKGNCAIFYSTKKPGIAFDADGKWLRMLPYGALRKGGYSLQRKIGGNGVPVKIEGISLSKNCVYAAAYTVNGVPMLAAEGIGRYSSFNEFQQLTLTGASAAELRAVKITAGKRGAATVSWTQAGVPKSIEIKGE